MSKTKPARGRPTKKPDDKLDATFLLNCKATEKERWAAIATRMELSLTALIRRTMNKLK